MVDKVALVQGFHRVFLCFSPPPPVAIIPLMPHTHFMESLLLIEGQMNEVCEPLQGSSLVEIGENDVQKKKKNSVALVRERTIPTERPPPVGEVSANFCG